MQVMDEHCAGLDVHQKTVVACILTPTGQEMRTFGTTTSELLALAYWPLAVATRMSPWRVPAITGRLMKGLPSPTLHESRAWYTAQIGVWAKVATGNGALSSLGR
jgi:hypothetical protein